MTCFTVGHRENYEETQRINLEAGYTFRKVKGGVCFPAIGDARWARDNWRFEPPGEYSVWELDADFETDAEQDPDGGWWYVLKREVPIIRRID